MISGHAAAVERATKLASERGAKRAIMLSGQRTLSLFADEAGAGPSGSGSTVSAISKAGSSGRLQCRCGIIEDADLARDALVRQVTGAVKWDPSMRLLIAKGIQTFVEVGPGKVLCGLMRQIDRSKTCLNVGDEASLQKLWNNWREASSALFSWL